MNIISIGNSFSQDAQRWLYEIAQCGGLDLETVNLYIGGCSLKQHAENLNSNVECYEYQLNGQPASKMISLSAAFDEKEWDIITYQQASHYSGMPQTYIPYLTELDSFVKRHCPNAKRFIHQTWAYETDSSHRGFTFYDNNQKEMMRRLTDAYEMASRLIQADIIPVGRVIQRLREETTEFDYAKTGCSLCRDGFHLSYDYGRYAAAAVWYEKIVGGSILENPFVPNNNGVQADPALIKIIRQVVHQTVHE